MAIPRWDLIPRVADHPQGREWLQTLAHLQRAPNTLDAYGRSLETFLTWCVKESVEPVQATKFHVVQYLAHQGGDGTLLNLQSGAEVSLSTLQLRFSALRGFFDHIVQDSLRQQNPIGRGRYSPASPKGAKQGLLPRRKMRAWIPTDEQ
jgi:site-specific recombinase XerD